MQNAFTAPDPETEEALALPPALVQTVLHPITGWVLRAMRTDSGALVDHLSRVLEEMQATRSAQHATLPVIADVSWVARDIPASVARRLLRFPLLPSSLALTAARRIDLVEALVLLHRVDRTALRFCERAKLVEWTKRIHRAHRVGNVRIGDGARFDEPERGQQAFSSDEENDKEKGGEDEEDEEEDGGGAGDPTNDPE